MKATLDLPRFTGERVVPDRPELAELYREHLVRYLFATQLCRNQVVLDAACGLGYGADLLSHAGARLVLGFDIAPDTVAYAKARYGSPTVRFAVGDCLAFPIASQSIDLLVSFETIEHLTDSATFVAEVARVLSPHGTAVISTPNRATFPAGNAFHVREFERSELEGLLREVFPWVEIWQQDIVQVHRIVPPHSQSDELSHAVPCASFDVAAPSGVPAAYFVALCAQRRPDRLPAPTVLRAARDVTGHLRAMCAALIGGLHRSRRQTVSQGAAHEPGPG